MSYIIRGTRGWKMLYGGGIFRPPGRGAGTAVPEEITAAPRPRVSTLRAAFGGIALLAALIPCAPAHDAFAEYVWHRVEISAGPRQIDVTVKLTFFEEWSERERRRMDLDRDGRIARAEIEHYIAGLVNALNSQVTLFVAGRRVALVPLYAPEVDLLGSAGVVRAHHRLTLHYFATVPPELTPGAAIVVEDRLWPEALCFGEIDATAVAGGGALKVAGVTDREALPDGVETPLRFSANYITTPAARTAAP
jgi:hypothetical protein